jgi:hypothetical protein
MTPREVGYTLFGLYLTVGGIWFGADVLRLLGWLNEYTLMVLISVILIFAMQVFRRVPED